MSNSLRPRGLQYVKFLCPSPTPRACSNSWYIVRFSNKEILVGLTITLINSSHCKNGFLGGSDGKIVCLQCWRPKFDPWVGKIPWGRKRQPTPVLLPGKFHGWRNFIGYSPWSRKESDITERLHFLSFSFTVKISITLNRSPFSTK